MSHECMSRDQDNGVFLMLCNCLSISFKMVTWQILPPNDHLELCGKDYLTATKRGES